MSAFAFLCDRCALCGKSRPRPRRGLAIASWPPGARFVGREFGYHRLDEWRKQGLEENAKWRLDPATPDRCADLDERMRKAKAAAADLLACRSDAGVARPREVA